MGGIGNQVGIQQEAPKTWAEVTQTHNSFSVRTATALLALSLVAGQAGAESKKVDPLQTGAQSTLLAQASTETDGKTYQAEVIQVDGTKKKVSYQKYKDGVIIPPETNDWKLVDGSPATSNQKLNIGKNRSILARHDKDSQILLALVDKKDILGKSLKDMWILIKKVQDNESILKDDVFNAMVWAYVLISSGDNRQDAIDGIETVAKVKMKLSLQEITAMKQQAKMRAMEIWKSVIWDWQ